MGRRSGRLLAAAALLLPLAAGCLGDGTKMQYFTLGSIEPRAATPLVTRPTLGIAIGPIEFPRYLDRPEIVTRDGAHRLVLSNANRWAGSFRSDVLRVLADDIGTLLGTSRIAVFPSEAPFSLDYRVLIDLREFEGVLGESVTLRARWMVVSASDATSFFVEDSTFVQTTDSASFEDFVAAQRRALGMLSHTVAVQLASLPAPAAGVK
jgi:uncharacterized lipoprotein YmbA